MRFFLLTTLLCLFTFCSDDMNEGGGGGSWSVQLEAVCGGAGVFHCVTEQEKDRVDGLIIPGSACQRVTITDVNGVTHTGFLRSVGTDSFC